MKYLLPLLLLTSCAARSASSPEGLTKVKPLAPIVAQQVHDLTPLVVWAGFAAVVVLTVGCVAGYLLRSRDAVMAGVIGFVTLAGGAMAIQQFAAFIPGIIIAGLISVAGWALWAKFGLKKVVLSHEAQLNSVVTSLENGVAHDKAQATRIADSVRQHLHLVHTNKIPLVPVAVSPVPPTTVVVGANLP